MTAVVLQPPTILPLHRGIARMESMTMSADRMIKYQAKCPDCHATFLWTMHERYNTLRPLDRVQIDICFVSHDDPSGSNKMAWLTPRGGNGDDDDALPADVILSGQYPEHDHAQRMWMLPIKGPVFVMLYEESSVPPASCQFNETLKHTNVAAFLIDVRLTRLEAVHT